MNICIPIVEDRGFLSPISPHFARAPMFLLVEPSSLAHRCIPNPDPEPGRCDLHGALDHEPIGSFIVGGSARMPWASSRAGTCRCTGLAAATSRMPSPR